MDTGWTGSSESLVVRKYLFFGLFSDLFFDLFFYVYLLAQRLTSPVYIMSSWCCVDSLTTCEAEERNRERGWGAEETKKVVHVNECRLLRRRREAVF